MQYSFPELFFSNPPERQHFLIVVSTNLELNAILQSMEPLFACEQDFKLPLNLENGELKTILYKDNTYTFFVCGVGPLNASFYIGHLLGQLLPVLKQANTQLNLILNLGLAGGFNLNQLALGEPVFAHSELFPEYGLRYADSVNAEALGFPLARGTNKLFGAESLENKPAIQEKIIWNKLNLLTEKDLQLLSLRVNINCLASIKQGLGISVSGVSACMLRAEQLQNEYATTKDDILFENMEGFSLGLAGVKLNIPFLELRAISNLVGSRAKKDWNIPLALQTLSSLAKNILWY